MTERTAYKLDISHPGMGFDLAGRADIRVEKSAQRVEGPHIWVQP
jgi:hypothetical protein